MSLIKTLYPMLSTGSTQEDRKMLPTLKAGIFESKQPAHEIFIFIQLSNNEGSDEPTQMCRFPTVIAFCKV